MVFGVGLAASRAPESAKAVAMLPELHALNVASRAIHVTTLQQSLAVVKSELTRTLVLTKLCTTPLTNSLGIDKVRL